LSGCSELGRDNDLKRAAVRFEGEICNREGDFGEREERGKSLSGVVWGRKGFIGRREGVKCKI